MLKGDGMTATATAATAAATTRRPFGTLAGGDSVEAITLANASGVRATVLTWGASLQSLLLPGRDGALADVVLGHAELGPYLDQPQYLGATVGRVANRIAGGRFTLDGIEHRVPCNDGPNALHGGARGFDSVNWTVAGSHDIDSAGVTLRHVSPDGDQGFPGTLAVTAAYMLTAANELVIDYRAETDRPTIINITNHAYWNLAGEGSAGGAMDHQLQIFADHFLPTDRTAIPTGEFRRVDGTAFDFRAPAIIGDRVRDATDDQIRVGRGYDHNWVIATGTASVPRRLARLCHADSGRMFDLFSNQPGLQCYSGNFLDATSIGKSGKLYRMGDAVVLEPQMFPDTPNRPAFGSLRLDPGELYHHRIVYRFGIAGAG